MSQPPHLVRRRESVLCFKTNQDPIISDTEPPIPPAFGTNTSSPIRTGNPTDTINNTTTTNVVQNIVDENLPQLLDSRGGYQVTNVPEFNDEDFSSLKDRRLANQDKRLKRPSETKDTKIAALRLKLNAFKVLEGKKVNGTFTRLRSLLNDHENNGVSIYQAEVNATFVNSLPRKWLKSSRFTLQGLKALISNPTMQESNSDIEEDQRSSNELLANLNAEFHKRALLANQRRFYKRSGRLEGLMFGCPMHIHNHKDHLGNFDENANDGFFLRYSPMAKAFRLEPLNANDSPVLNEPIESTNNLEPIEVQVSFINEPISEAIPLTSFPLEPLVPQDRWSREKHIEVVNIIGEPLIGVTTRSRVRDSKAASSHECLYVNFLSQIEPKRPTEALEEEGWIIAMQEELNRLKINKVWTLVPLLNGKTIIGTKWTYRNKMDKHGVVIKNKARLLSQGFRQEERIDCDETFTPVARLEAIRIFLVYAANMGFTVYQMDMKSAFLNNKILKEVYVQQPPGFESSEFPNHVCKLDKALYRLKQAPRACASVKCPMLPPNNLGPDESRVSVNEIMFRVMIRYPANPKESYFVVVKRSFRYLKGTPNLGLWYPKGSGFDLKAYSDSEYAGCNLDRKSTLG
nr:retrovirus-related Pol polyprotein from transposon TNT 1-94 [Tanacetum cinerariifolium]